MEEKETRLLLDTFRLKQIGFEKNENLKYETTYGSWKPVDSHIGEEYIDHEKIEEIENNLKSVEDLIEEYFSIDPQNHLEKILFIIADFGKGKSVFMKTYAAKLAQKYAEEKEGFFPIYFNLRNFKQYLNTDHLGVINDYLLTEYGININSDKFRNKKYVFLIDSLDESGELNQASIQAVISSVKQIQNLNRELYRTNRLIITSRPFSDGLKEVIHIHKPYCLKEEEREIPHYISLYGFKKDQFNNWLYDTLKKKAPHEKSKLVDFVDQIYKDIQSQKKTDIYQQLLENGTLQVSELRRPIFAYMIYQLILNNIDFLSVGKIGIYLSFLNLLTKEAKHINDPHYKISLQEEFEFRNLLHATAALWMYERHNGNQGSLKKADLCRLLDGESKYDKNKSDKEILQDYANKGATDIQFLSHSYFGENNNTLHFQHQSFAEILLAEYYLKIFIKFALDENPDVDEARARLSLGKPTEQTIMFLKSLLQLLRETAIPDPTPEVIEKRKLLFPFLSSIAISKNNFLFSPAMHYDWYRNCHFTPSSTEYPRETLENWYMDQEKINKILDLSKKIIESPNFF
ncbi:MAG: NACHT domain-containing protein [Tannerellaceae bacterium]|nr:NACHT domain-containing protein [Tannerellaceae bacterium]